MNVVGIKKVTSVLASKEVKLIPSFEPQTNQDVGCLPLTDSKRYDVIMTREGSFICKKFPETFTPSILVVGIFPDNISGNPVDTYPEPDQ